jgi:hypothetical protein
VNGKANAQLATDPHSSRYWNMTPDGDYFRLENSRSRRNLSLDDVSTSTGAAAIDENLSGGINHGRRIALPSGASGVTALRTRKRHLYQVTTGANTVNGTQAAHFTLTGRPTNASTSRRRDLAPCAPGQA